MITMQMPNLYFPISGFFIALLLVFTYFSKKRINNVETKIFTYMIIASLINSIMACTMIFLGYLYGIQPITQILNIVDFWAILTWAWLLFIYIFHISFKEKKNFYKHFKKITKLTGIINILIAIALPYFRIIPVYEDGIMYAHGTAVDILYITCGIYLLLIIVSVLTNIKNISDKKYKPLYVLVILGIIMFVMRQINPGLPLISAMFVYINLVMYFTIENPDVKILRELNIAKLQADSDLNTKNEWLKQMRHEINTPAGQALMFTDAIKDIAHKTKNDELLEYANYVDVSLKDIVAINSNAVILANIQNKNFELVEGVYKTEELVERVNQIVKYNFNREKENVKFKLKIDKTFPKFLIGDLENIERVILIYLSNAFKYTKKGTVELCIKSEIIGSECTMTITVKDTGMGIQKENLKKLFKEFERIEFNQTQGNIRGIGLGLSIAKQLVEIMNGSVKAESVYGEGSTFSAIIKQKIPKGEV